MAKTLVQGAFQNTGWVAIYTAPSTKYAKLTFMYCGLYQHQSNSTSGNYHNRMSVNDIEVVGGHFPYVGQVPMAGTSPNNSTIQGKVDNTLLLPPSAVLRLKNWASSIGYDEKYAFIVEEIASSTVLA